MKKLNKELVKEVCIQLLDSKSHQIKEGVESTLPHT